MRNPAPPTAASRVINWFRVGERRCYLCQFSDISDLRVRTPMLSKKSLCNAGTPGFSSFLRPSTIYTGFHAYKVLCRKPSVITFAFNFASRFVGPACGCILSFVLVLRLYFARADAHSSGHQPSGFRQNPTPL
jgi:hypothetical protein